MENMRIISDIYLYVPPVLMDHYLTSTFIESDKTQGFEDEEKQRREKVQAFNAKHYGEPLQADTLGPYEHLRQLQSSLQLEDAWKADYRRWLEQNVFAEPSFAT